MSLGRAFLTAAAGFVVAIAAAAARGQAVEAGADDPAALGGRLRAAVQWLAAPEREGGEDGDGDERGLVDHRGGSLSVLL